MGPGALPSTPLQGRSPDWPGPRAHRGPRTGTAALPAGTGRGGGWGALLSDVQLTQASCKGLSVAVGATQAA